MPLDQDWLVLMGLTAGQKNLQQVLNWLDLGIEDNTGPR